MNQMNARNKTEKLETITTGSVKEHQQNAIYESRGERSREKWKLSLHVKSKLCVMHREYDVPQNRCQRKTLVVVSVESKTAQIRRKHVLQMPREAVIPNIKRKLVLFARWHRLS